MFEIVQDIFAKQLRLDKSKITLSSKIKDDLGADSLDVLQILMTIEEEHGIVIPDEDLLSFTTVEDVVKYMESRQKG